ncbi:Stage VI sporulation protein F [Salinibacillus kushneri]|uniref:Stage VI sporulation protein F n=1 Tax=Salinibacillus kushneri TaxID=237682 RepID=A0A1I0CNQ6_9BACI|nr:stage VI sporulation protein F [Salinibacillus kushneri]SET21127.1 Stage VI sporulation protein F [Salinibacillus kushneri]
MDRGFFKNVEKSTGVKQDDIMKLVKSVQNADLSDEKTVRKLINRVSKMAKKPVSKQTEDRLVQSIINKQIPSMNDIKKKF